MFLEMLSALKIYEVYLILTGKAALYLVACVLIAWLAGKFWDTFMGKLAARTVIEIDGSLVSVSHRPLVFLVYLISIKFAFRSLSEEPAWQGLPLFTSLDNLLYTAVVIVLAVWIDSAVHSVVEWYSRDYSSRTQGSLEQFLPLVRQLMRLMVYFLAATFILAHFGKNITGLIATAGVASLAIALAAQETLSNMFAGLMIMIDRPFRPGDRIELDKGQLGDVIQIGTRTTRILTLDNTVIVVPNKELANSRIINHVFPTPQINLRFKVGVAYDSDLFAVKAVLNGILAENPRVMNDPAPGIYFTDFGESSLNLAINCWITDYKDRFPVTDELNTAIKERFERAGIEIPFPRRDIRFTPTGLSHALEHVDEANKRVHEAAAGND